MVLKHYVEPSPEYSFLESRTGDVIITTINTEGERILFGMKSDPPLQSSMSFHGYKTHIRNHIVSTMTTPLLDVGDVHIYTNSSQLVFDNMTFSPSSLTIDEQKCVMSLDVNVQDRVDAQDMYVEHHTSVGGAVTIGDAGVPVGLAVTTDAKLDIQANYFEIDPLYEEEYDAENMDVDLLIIRPPNPESALLVYGDAYMPNATKFAKSMNVDADINVGADATIARNIFIGTSMKASMLEIANTLLVGGAIQFGKSTSIGGNVVINGDTNMSNFALQIDYTTTFNKNLSVKNMSVSDIVFYNQSVSCRNIFSVDNELYVGGDATFANAFCRYIDFRGSNVTMNNLEIYGNLNVLHTIASSTTKTDFASVKPLESYGRVLDPITVQGSLVSNITLFKNDISMKDLDCNSNIVCNSISSASASATSGSNFNIISSNFISLQNNLSTSNISCSNNTILGKVTTNFANYENCIFEKNLHCKNFSTGHLKCRDVSVKNNFVTGRLDDCHSVQVRTGTNCSIATSTSCSIASTFIMDSFRVNSASCVQLSCHGLDSHTSNFDAVQVKGDTACTNMGVLDTMDCDTFETSYLQSEHVTCSSMRVIGTSILHAPLIVKGRCDLVDVNATTITTPSLAVSSTMDVKNCQSTNIFATNMFVPGTATLGTTIATTVQCFIIPTIVNVSTRDLNASTALLDSLTSSTSRINSLVTGTTKCLTNARTKVGFAGNIETSILNAGYATCLSESYITSLGCSSSMSALGTSTIECDAQSLSMTSLGSLRATTIGATTLQATDAHSANTALPTTKAAQLNANDLVVHGSATVYDMESQTNFRVLEETSFKSKATINNLSCIGNVDSTINMRITQATLSTVSTNSGSIGVCTCTNTLTSATTTTQGDAVFERATLASATCSKNLQANSVTSQVMSADRTISCQVSFNATGDVACRSASFATAVCASKGNIARLAVRDKMRTETSEATTCDISLGIASNLAVSGQIVAKNAGFSSALELSSLVCGGTCSLVDAEFQRGVDAPSGMAWPSATFSNVTVYGLASAGVLGNLVRLDSTKMTANSMTHNSFACEQATFGGLSVLSSLKLLSDMTTESLSANNLSAPSKTIAQKLIVSGDVVARKIANVSAFNDGVTFLDANSSLLMRCSASGLDLDTLDMYAQAAQMSTNVNASYKGSIAKNMPVLSAFATSGSYTHLIKTGIASEAFLTSGNYGHLSSCPDMGLYVKKSVASARMRDISERVSTLNSKIERLDFVISSDKVDATLCAPIVATVPTSYPGLQSFATSSSFGTSISFSKSFSTDYAWTVGTLKFDYRPIKLVSNKPNQFVVAKAPTKCILTADIAWNSTGGLDYRMSYAGFTPKALLAAATSGMCYISSDGNVINEKWPSEYPSNAQYATCSVPSPQTAARVTVGNTLNAVVFQSSPGSVTFKIWPGTTLAHGSSSTLSGATLVANNSWDAPFTTSVTYGSIFYFAYGASTRPQNVYVNTNNVLISPYTFISAQSSVSIPSFPPYTRVSCYQGKAPSYYGYSLILENGSNTAISTTATPTTSINSVVVDKIYQSQAYVRFHNDTLCKGLWVDFTPIKARTWAQGLHIKHYEILTPVVECGINYLYAKLVVVCKSIVLGPRTAVELSSDASTWAKFSNEQASGFVNVDLTQYGYDGTAMKVNFFKLYLIQ